MRKDIDVGAESDQHSCPIAVVGTTVIEVHNAKTGVGPLWYSTGTVNVEAKTIKWQGSTQYKAVGLSLRWSEVTRGTAAKENLCSALY